MSDNASERQKIEQRSRAFEAAFNAGDLTAHTALYTEDATVLPPDSAAVTGRAGIQRFWQGVRDSGVPRIALTTLHVDVSGDLQAEVGTAELTAGGNDGQTTTIPLKYVVVWKHQDRGAWQLAVDIWNGNPAG